MTTSEISHQVQREFETLKSKNYTEDTLESLQHELPNPPPMRKMDEGMTAQATPDIQVESESHHEQASRYGKKTNQNQVPQKNRMGYSRGCCMFMFRCRLCPCSCEIGMTF